VAFFGDVHGNLHALDAVLGDLARRRVRQAWCLGDLVGYGAFPDQVVRRLRAAGIPCLKGNYDRKVLDYPRKAAAWARKKRPEKLLAFRWAHEHLSSGSRAFLAGLPDSLALELAGRSVRLVHEGPPPCEYLGPGVDPGELERARARAGAEVLVAAHTHRPFAAEVPGGWVVNTGAVGRPEGDPRACYALLELGPRGVRVCHVRVAYPVEEAARAILAAGLPEGFAAMLRAGAPLDALAPAEAQGLEWSCRELLGRALPAELEHARQVARLADLLFEGLRPLHRLPEEARRRLACAAWLHDLGWVEGARGHHKASQRLILEDRELPLSPEERRRVALVARYHRKALPGPRHPEYAGLAREARREVRLLSGMLRLADGLDRGHRARVLELDCRLLPGEVRVRCRTRGPSAAERAAAEDKADLLRAALGRELSLAWGRTDEEG
jgi:predicted phosphodiesterase